MKKPSIANKAYWFCLIGPAQKDELPMGADSPLRMAVRQKFEKVTGHSEDVCSSGWGVSEPKYDVLRTLCVMSESDPDFKKIQGILSKRKLQ